MCNFALQLEDEVEAGQKAHSELEEQFEMLTQVRELAYCFVYGEGGKGRRKGEKVEKRKWRRV